MEGRMERIKFIGRSVSLQTPVFCRSQFTLYASLITIFMLLFSLPVSAFAAEKLIVKDSGGTTQFLVDDSGKVGIGITPSASLEAYTPAGQNPTDRISDGD